MQQTVVSKNLFASQQKNINVGVVEKLFGSRPTNKGKLPTTNSSLGLATDAACSPLAVMAQHQSEE